jgi:hypothetical protein
MGSAGSSRSPKLSHYTKSSGFDPARLMFGSCPRNGSYGTADVFDAGLVFDAAAARHPDVSPVERHAPKQETRNYLRARLL